MRICVVCVGFSSVFGGLETVYTQLFKMWTKNGHEVFCISGSGSIRSSREYLVFKGLFIPRGLFEQLQRKIKKLPLESYELEGLSCAPFVALRLIQLKPDIVLSNTLFETFIPLKFGFPCVMMSQAPIQYRLKLFERVDRVIVNDSQSYKQLKKLGIKTEFILNGVGIPAFQNVAVRKLRAKYSIPNESRVILTVARLYTRKRIHLLINAFELIKQPAILIIIGEGPELSSLRRQALQFNSKNKILFLQKVSLEEQNEFYQLYDVFTFPSESEGMPLVILEALSFGKTVVTNLAPEKKFILEKFGVFTNVENPAEYSNSLLDAFSKKIDINSNDYLHHMKKFNWNDIALQYIEVFQDVLQKRETKRRSP